MLFLLHADGLDLHQRAPGQRTHLHGGTGGILALGEKLGVHRVHGGEVAHALQEHGGLDHVVHGQAGSPQNGLDIGQHLAGLLGDAAGNKLAGGGVKGHLAGGDEEAAAVDGLRVRADGGGGVGGGNDLLHGNDLLMILILAAPGKPGDFLIPLIPRFDGNGNSPNFFKLLSLLLIIYFHQSKFVFTSIFRQHIQWFPIYSG